MARGSVCDLKISTFISPKIIIEDRLEYTKCLIADIPVRSLQELRVPFLGDFLTLLANFGQF